MEANVRTVGVVGGLGPSTGFSFCLAVNDQFRSITGSQPNIIVENIPVSLEMEEEIIKGGTPLKMLELIKIAIKRLNNCGVDFIVIPCNTVHFFIEELRKTSNKPLLSIIDGCVNSCKDKNLKTVGILASTKSIKSRLHIIPLENNNIRVIIPNKKEQRTVDEIIIKIIHGKIQENDKSVLLNLIKKFKNNGAEAVILGCTDLPFVVNKQNSSLPIIDTLELLQKATVNNLLNGDVK